MKIYLSQITSLTLTLGIFSCGGNSEKVNEPVNFSFELVDSVEVDFLGDLKLIDYDAKEDKYLLITSYSEEYLEVDKIGKILTHKEFTSDGLDAVGSILGSGYVDGKVTVLSETKGYLMYRDGLRTDEITIPYTFEPYTFYQKLVVFNYDGKIYYPKPWPSSSAIVIGSPDFYQELYKTPIIEGQTIESKEIISVAALPETTSLQDGQMHGMIFPVFTETENFVLISNWIEPLIYVYRKSNGEIVYDKTVQLEIPDWVRYSPTAKEDLEGFFGQNNKVRTGNLIDILEVEDYFVAVYNKGIDEIKMPEQDADRDKYYLAIKMKNPYYAAVFDKEFNQLAVNVPFPATSAAPRVVNNKGEIVVSKDPSLSETEDDGIILYRLKLTSK